MGLRDRILGNIGTKIEEEKEKKATAKKEITVKAPSTNKRAVEGTAATTELQTVDSEFKSIRHLVEYLICKYPDIKFGKTEHVIKKYFPGQMYDAGTFMMIKLQFIRDKKLMYYEDLKKDFPSIMATGIEQKLSKEIHNEASND